MSMYQPFHRSPEQDATLDRVLARVRHVGARAVCVLDVDGCLMDTRHRQLHILRCWAEATGRYAVSKVGVEHFVDRDLARTLVYAGVPEAEATAWFRELRAFWAERFFDDEHVAYDAPFPGAARFLAEVAATGATLVYLTGRNTSMRPAGERSFRQAGFPLGKNAYFLDKPDPRTEDHLHKVAYFDAIAAVGEVALTMDNEPLNINLLADRFPDALNVWLASDRSDRPIEPHAHLPVIRGFLRTSDLRD
jgi:hypothetical protein